MSKFLTSLSLATLLAASTASAQTADPPRTEPQTPPAATSPSPSTSAPVPSSPSATDADRPAGLQAGSTMGSSIKLSDAEAKEWVGKTVYSSDDKNLGEVAAFQRGSDGKVQEMHADIGGFLGIGETRVRVLPSEFTLSGDRIILKMTGDQAKALPKLEK